MEPQCQSSAIRVIWQFIGSNPYVGPNYYMFPNLLTDSKHLFKELLSLVNKAGNVGLHADNRSPPKKSCHVRKPVPNDVKSRFILNPTNMPNFPRNPPRVNSSITIAYVQRARARDALTMKKPLGVICSHC